MEIRRATPLDINKIETFYEQMARDHNIQLDVHMSYKKRRKDILLHLKDRECYFFIATQDNDDVIASIAVRTSKFAHIYVSYLATAKDYKDKKSLLFNIVNHALNVIFSQNRSVIKVVFNLRKPRHIKPIMCLVKTMGYQSEIIDISQSWRERRLFGKYNQALEISTHYHE